MKKTFKIKSVNEVEKTMVVEFGVDAEIFELNMPIPLDLVGQPLTEASMKRALIQGAYYEIKKRVLAAMATPVDLTKVKVLVNKLIDATAEFDDQDALLIEDTLANAPKTQITEQLVS